MARRRSNGEGTIYRRKDGRYEGAVYVTTTTGRTKRLRVYGGSREEAHVKLTAIQSQAHQGLPVPDRSWRLGEYLDYWLENVVKPSRRPTTFLLYEMIVRLYLKPGLGNEILFRLSVPGLQTFLNQQLAHGHSIRKVQIMRSVLSGALTRAQREEIVTRNIARLVELPTWERREVHPWSATEAEQFLQAARPKPLYLAFLVLVLYGLRRGEVLGLRWKDIDFSAGTIEIHQQLQRIDHELRQGPVKTRAGRRVLPLLGLVRDALATHQIRQQQLRQAAGADWAGGPLADELLFTTRSGLPVGPDNFADSFRAMCRQAGVRVITVHHVRHTAATLLKNCNVPARDAQLILGHSRVSTTQEIYQHDDLEGRKEALERVERLFLRVADGNGSREFSRQDSHRFENYIGSISGGVWRIRTARLLRAMNSALSRDTSIQSVRRVMHARTTQWLLGLVAVRLSRQGEEAPWLVE